VKNIKVPDVMEIIENNLRVKNIKVPKIIFERKF